MDDYRRQLIERITDSSNWPSFDRPGFLDNLINMADAASYFLGNEGLLHVLKAPWTEGDVIQRLAGRIAEARRRAGLDGG